ncbi:MAG TPA: cytochrome c [Pyrinomonadaceae bacterium]|nr:cytochrome c [Pyrinomonadaceae bacterium]
MKTTFLVLACTVLALLAIACTETAAPTNSAAPTAATSAGTPVDEFAAARQNFQKNCESCHGPNYEGGLVKVEGKQIKVPSLKADHAVKHTDEQLIKMITNGEEAMPSFKDKLKPEEITDLVKFVRKQVQGK